MGQRDLSDFNKEFESYEYCVPPGVLLPQIQIEKRFHKELGLNEDQIDDLFDVISMEFPDL